MGPEDQWITLIVAVLIILDTISGIIAAFLHKEVASQEMRSGVWHKSAYVFILGAAAIMQWGATHIDSLSLPIYMPLACFIGLTEIISIIENACKINPDLDERKIASFFPQIKDNDIKDKEDNSDDDERD